MTFYYENGSPSRGIGQVDVDTTELHRRGGEVEPELGDVWASVRQVRLTVSGLEEHPVVIGGLDSADEYPTAVRFLGDDDLSVDDDDGGDLMFATIAERGALNRNPSLGRRGNTNAYTDVEWEAAMSAD